MPEANLRLLWKFPSSEREFLNTDSRHEEFAD